MVDSVGSTTVFASAIKGFLATTEAISLRPEIFY